MLLDVGTDIRPKQQDLIEVIESRINQHDEFFKGLQTDAMVICHIAKLLLVPSPTDYNKAVKLKIISAHVLSMLAHNPSNLTTYSQHLDLLIKVVSSNLNTQECDGHCAYIVSKAILTCCKNSKTIAHLTESTLQAAVRLVKQTHAREAAESDGPLKNYFYRLLQNLVEWLCHLLRTTKWRQQLSDSTLPIVLHLGKGNLKLYTEISQYSQVSPSKPGLSDNVFSIPSSKGQTIKAMTIADETPTSYLLHKFLMHSFHSVEVLGLIEGKPLFVYYPTITHCIKKYKNNSTDKNGIIFDLGWFVNIALTIATEMKHLHAVGLAVGKFRLADVRSDHNFQVKLLWRCLVADGQSNLCSLPFDMDPSIPCAPEIKSKSFRSLIPVDVFNFGNVLSQLMIIAKGGKTVKSKLPPSTPQSVQSLIRQMCQSNPASRPSISTVIDKLWAIQKEALIVYKSNSKQVYQSYYQLLCLPQPLWSILQAHLSLKDQVSLSCTCQLLRFSMFNYQTSTS
eukprot:TRINITY_DN14980_c0_g1_i3.p1 TRINITY_DN14980_c0_g1~~TRINITY_DN14980_c0_g1_i3.p1  ORF type:complete len:508 (+),score=83.40 TRINITY_DN14980_c0_g1_i3:735-2258(+)